MIKFNDDVRGIKRCESNKTRLKIRHAVFMNLRGYTPANRGRTRQNEKLILFIVKYLPWFRLAEYARPALVENIFVPWKSVMTAM